MARAGRGDREGETPSPPRWSRCDRLRATGPSHVQAVTKSPESAPLEGQPSRILPPMSLARSTARITLLNLCGYLVSLSVHILFAGMFGARLSADAWFSAVAVPNFLTFALFASLGKACLPVFVSVRKERGAEWFAVLSGIANLTFIGLGVLAVLVTIYSEPLTRLLVPDFDPARLALTRTLLEIAIWAIPAAGASLVLAAALQGLRKFALPATATLAQPIGLITGLLLFRESMGVASMAFGLVAGCWAQLLILLVATFRTGRYRPRFHLGDEGVRRILTLLPPLFFAAALVTAYLIIEKRFASGIADPAVGPVSWLDYGRRPANLLIMLFGTSLIITSYTSFAESAARKDLVELRSRTWRAAVILFLVILPGAILLFVFAGDAISLVFERGRFGPRDTEHAAAVLRLLLPFLVLAAAGRVLNHAFLALRKVKVPVLAAMAGLLVYATLGIPMRNAFGYRGLALLAGIGISVTAIFTGTALLLLLGRPRGEGILKSLLQMALAGAVTATILWFARDLIPPRGNPFLLRAAILGALGAVSLAVYLGVLAVCRNIHLAQVIRALAKRNVSDDGALPGDRTSSP